jgi:hypothetical protein
MDDALQHRLDRIDRRQRYILVLLIYPYLAAGTWLALNDAVVAATAPALGIVVVAYLVTLVRARTGGEAGVGTETATE